MTRMMTLYINIHCSIQTYSIMVIHLALNRVRGVAPPPASHSSLALDVRRNPLICYFYVPHHIVNFVYDFTRMLFTSIFSSALNIIPFSCAYGYMIINSDFYSVTLYGTLSFVTWYTSNGRTEAATLTFKLFHSSSFNVVRFVVYCKSFCQS